MRILLGLAAAIAVTSTAQAGPFQDKLTKVGKWTVFKNINSKTDKVSCVATYDGSDNRIQLSAVALAIAYPATDGVRTYRLQLDNTPRSDLNLAVRKVKNVDALVFDDGAFSQIQAAKQLRIQTQSVPRTVQDDEIDLRSLPAVIQVMNGPSCATPVRPICGWSAHAPPGFCG